ncbi:hypothetical protein M0R19_08515 [Candidatus Pacearchaeota archaeon]|jgi:hypothetical protein|nr:hypothetical protein [bacterium]MCK9597200.1 hypothetical protein [Candidatus Pacearchaeota archaeon]
MKFSFKLVWEFEALDDPAAKKIIKKIEEEVSKLNNIQKPTNIILSNLDRSTGNILKR